mmetsp:Transcript_10081/g.21022  ORF Transcript_10081/g.21022 Transcript_10081/m.21022 type:complete len:267 (+) Transcript_10081:290-1090(+)
MCTPSTDPTAAPSTTTTTARSLMSLSGLFALGVGQVLPQEAGHLRPVVLLCHPHVHVPPLGEIYPLAARRAVHLVQLLHVPLRDHLVLPAREEQDRAQDLLHELDLLPLGLDDPVEGAPLVAYEEPEEGQQRGREGGDGHERVLQQHRLHRGGVLGGEPAGDGPPQGAAEERDGGGVDVVAREEVVERRLRVQLQPALRGGPLALPVPAVRQDEDVHVQPRDQLHHVLHPVRDVAGVLLEEDDGGTFLVGVRLDQPAVDLDTVLSD